MSKVTEKRFCSYDEAMAYLSYLFDLVGHWEAIISWSERNEVDDRPYRLVVINPTGSTIQAIRKLRETDINYCEEVECKK